MDNDFNQSVLRTDADAPALVVGLDAGGTRTRAVLATAADGRPLGEGSAGPGNALTVPLPELTDHLVEAVARAVPEAWRGRVVAVAGGFAGATGVSADDRGHRNALTALTVALRSLGITAGPPGICSDIEAAFASAPGTPADGLALVAGTGAVAMRITDRHCTATVDGDGWLLGDDGSGFWIGRAAVRAALRMADGRGRETVLAGSVGRALGLPEGVLPEGVSRPEGSHGGASQEGGSQSEGSQGGASQEGGSQEGGSQSEGPTSWPRSGREAYRMHLLPVVMAELPIRLARLAPLVVEAAQDKDAVALAILDEAADQLTATVRALDPQPGERVVATGGLLGPDGPLTGLLAARLHTLGLPLDWVADGCRGAVALARLEYGRRS
ncbi:N-acetylglucosamine kinase [Streptomyces pseudovenezuelae]|uniref:Glucosamine kinase n=1 Tax=Streptomyces pseudovenezuelae TaxID=67350 RepID=A0ABT6LQP4_9ACTN|nr:BadF/BadG/BcrA/BcrD ATPase family protein [Streptomyces pseudovenezuelae]MDH6218631.1 glucosamine kinase [Streptomyces pseudovenezuelae]